MGMKISTQPVLFSSILFSLWGGVELKSHAYLHYNHSVWAAVPASSIKNLPERSTLMRTVQFYRPWHQWHSEWFYRVSTQTTQLWKSLQCGASWRCTVRETPAPPVLREEVLTTSFEFFQLLSVFVSRTPRFCLPCSCPGWSHAGVHTGLSIFY